jgi:hypothetical protein
MSPVASHLKKAEKKLEQLNNLRDAAYNHSEINFKGRKVTGQNKFRIEDEIEKAYEEYALLKIRYLMDTL